jgi:hypothetical protein
MGTRGNTLCGGMYAARSGVQQFGQGIGAQINNSVRPLLRVALATLAGHNPCQREQCKQSPASMSTVVIRRHDVCRLAVM